MKPPAPYWRASSRVRMPVVMVRFCSEAVRSYSSISSGKRRRTVRMGSSADRDHWMPRWRSDCGENMSGVVWNEKSYISS